MFEFREAKWNQVARHERATNHTNRTGQSCTRAVFKIVASGAITFVAYINNNNRATNERFLLIKRLTVNSPIHANNILLMLPYMQKVGCYAIIH